MDGPDCPNELTYVKALAGSKLVIWDLAPIFDGAGKLTDFKMISWEINGNQTSFKSKCKDTVGFGMITGARHQADIWGGLFTYSHAPGSPFVDWLITYQNSEIGRSGIVGELIFDWPNRTPIFGGQVNELTGVQIVKLP